MIPREAFVGSAARHLAYTNSAIAHGKGSLQMVPPSVEVCILEGLEVQAGMTVLDVGFGSGFLTTLLAYLAQAPRAVLAVETHPEAFVYGRNNCVHVLQARRLEHVPQPQFVHGNVLEMLNHLGTFDRLHVGA